MDRILVKIGNFLLISSIIMGGFFALTWPFFVTWVILHFIIKWW